MQPLNADRFRFPRITNKERSFIEAESRRDEVRADFRAMLAGARDTALLAALQRHLIAASAILDLIALSERRN